MSIDTAMKDASEKMAKALGHLKEDLTGIRTGRATPGILNRVTVEYYGTPVPLQQLASMSVPEPRTLMVQPFDKTAIGAIEKAILTSDLGVNPSNDGNVIRLSFPPLTEERRREFVKVVKHKGEEHKIAIRNERRDAKELIEEAVKEGDLTEDDGKKAMEKVQGEVDGGVKKVDEIIGAKEKDLMQV